MKINATYEEVETALDDFLEQDYEYQTKHPDVLSEVMSNIFTDYRDRNDVEVIFVDSIFPTSNCIDSAPICELEAQLPDDIVNMIDSLSEEEAERIRDAYCIHRDNLIYQSCGGHWELVRI